MSWVMSEKHANREGSTQKSSVTKQKWFVQEQAARGMLGGPHNTPEQATFPLRWTLEPPDELLEPTTSWTVL